MPPKKQPTIEDKRRKIRQEGRVGILKIDALLEDDIERILRAIDFQVMHQTSEMDTHSILYYGYCELFEPTSHGSKIPYYKLRADFSEPEPIIEVFKQR